MCGIQNCRVSCIKILSKLLQHSKKRFTVWIQVIYNNQPIEVLMKAAVDSVKAGEPVWFGSEVR